ncbi:glycosyltransferase [Klebsiella aerogenes]|nr:glycosyltransferase [Klebsiella aerogenes]
MKNKIDISIIIPAYNVAETIGSLVNKIFNETRVAIVLMIVDDGSTDDTGNVNQLRRAFMSISLAPA